MSPSLFGGKASRVGGVGVFGTGPRGFAFHGAGKLDYRREDKEPSRLFDVPFRPEAAIESIGCLTVVGKHRHIILSLMRPCRDASNRRGHYGAAVALPALTRDMARDLPEFEQTLVSHWGLTRHIADVLEAQALESGVFSLGDYELNLLVDRLAEEYDVDVDASPLAIERSSAPAMNRFAAEPDTHEAFQTGQPLFWLSTDAAFQNALIELIPPGAAPPQNALLITLDHLKIAQGSVGREKLRDMQDDQTFDSLMRRIEHLEAEVRTLRDQLAEYKLKRDGGRGARSKGRRSQRAMVDDEDAAAAPRYGTPAPAWPSGGVAASRLLPRGDADTVLIAVVFAVVTLFAALFTLWQVMGSGEAEDRVELEAPAATETRTVVLGGPIAACPGGVEGVLGALNGHIDDYSRYGGSNAAELSATDACVVAMAVGDPALSACEALQTEDVRAELRDLREGGGDAPARWTARRHLSSVIEQCWRGR